jgi:protein-S-isoprenylcysteine O-methyltransferase Ste14
MSRLAPPPSEESLKQIVSRVIDDGKDYARAEANLVKQIALAKVNAIRPAAIMLVVAVFLLQAALTVLAAALGMTLAIWLGVPGGLAVGALLVLAVVGLLAWLAVNRLKRIG